MGTLLKAVGIVLETYFGFEFPNRSPVGDSLKDNTHIYHSNREKKKRVGTVS